MATVPLSDVEVHAALRTLPEWARDGQALVRTFRRRDFSAAVALITAIADAAEEANHHPDLCLRRYRELEVRLTTHDAGGVTPPGGAPARRIGPPAGR